MTPDHGADADGDGFPDACDACPATFEAVQSDADGDGVGDACDDCASAIPLSATATGTRDLARTGGI